MSVIIHLELELIYENDGILTNTAVPHMVVCALSVFYR
mgnify:CR=1 FL=1